MRVNQKCRRAQRRGDDDIRVSLNMESPINQFFLQIRSGYELSGDAAALFMGILLTQKDFFCPMAELRMVAVPRPHIEPVAFRNAITELESKGIVRETQDGLLMNTIEIDGERCMAIPQADPAQ